MEEGKTKKNETESNAEQNAQAMETGKKEIELLAHQLSNKIIKELQVVKSSQKPKDMGLNSKHGTKLLDERRNGRNWRSSGTKS